MARARTREIEGERTKAGMWWFHQVELRPGENLVLLVKPSQLTNGWLFVALGVAIFTTIAGGGIGFGNGALYLVSVALYFRRMMPFWYVTDQRVVQVTTTPSAALEETSVDLDRITSVVKRDPILGSLLHLQGLDVFVAEGRNPKIAIRFLRDADGIQQLLSPSRR